MASPSSPINSEIRASSTPIKQMADVFRELSVDTAEECFKTLTKCNLIMAPVHQRLCSDLKSLNERRNSFVNHLAQGPSDYSALLKRHDEIAEAEIRTEKTTNILQNCIMMQSFVFLRCIHHLDIAMSHRLEQQVANLVKFLGRTGEYLDQREEERRLESMGHVLAGNILSP